MNDLLDSTPKWVSLSLSSLILNSWLTCELGCNQETTLLTTTTTSQVYFTSWKFCLTLHPKQMSHKKNNLNRLTDCFAHKSRKETRAQRTKKKRRWIDKNAVTQEEGLRRQDRKQRNEVSKRSYSVSYSSFSSFSLIKSKRSVTESTWLQVEKNLC